MKKNKPSRRLITFAILFFLTSCLVAEGVNIVFDPFIDQVVRFPTAGLYSYDAMGGYIINPDTILQRLNKGDTNVFMPEMATPIAPVYDGRIMWHQSDYIEIADALFQFKWKEPSSKWNVYSLELKTDCGENMGGFYYADIIYFNPIWIKSTILYTAREIEITPLYQDVGWGGNGPNYPHPILGWRGINLSKIEISAENALNIADANGGKALRSAIQNNCSVYLGLSGDYGWYIYYLNNASADMIFQIRIDPYTGRFYK